MAKKIGRRTSPRGKPARGLAKRKRRQPWRQLSTGDLLDEDVVEELEAEAEEGDDGAEPEDDSEIEEAELGVRDEFDGRETFGEPSTEPRDEIEADRPQGDSAYPAVTFFTRPNGTLGYAISEYRSPLVWKRLDILAQHLIEQCSEPTLRGLEGLRGTRRLMQKGFIVRLGGEGPHPKGEISELLQSTIVSLEGVYLSAVAFFRENVARTEEGRTRARELLQRGRDEQEVLQVLRAEFAAPRTTMLGWIATSRAKADKPTSRGKT